MGNADESDIMTFMDRRLTAEIQEVKSFVQDGRVHARVWTIDDGGFGSHFSTLLDFYTCEGQLWVSCIFQIGGTAGSAYEPYFVVVEPSPPIIQNRNRTYGEQQAEDLAAG